MKKVLITLFVLPLYFSCVTGTDNNSESRQSLFIKKSLILLNVEQSNLDSVKQDKTFASSKREQATPPKKIVKKYIVKTKIVNGRNVFIISPKNGSSEMTVLYLHGGAYMANFLSIHWQFIDKLIDTTGVTVIAPDYPLAPVGTWEDAFQMLDSIHGNLLTEYKNVQLMGDSAGAGLALAWTMDLKRRNLQTPEQLVLISPWLDISMVHPAISETEDADPYLSREALKIAGRYWAGKNKISSWQVSPLHGDLKGLPPITIFTGTADILNPDARLLHKKMKGSGFNLDFREYNYMIHNWVFFDMPEADECFNEIAYLFI